jgi:hypothetical protein
MAFDVTKTFQAGDAGKATDINQNFADIEAELNAFPTAGSLKEGSITNSMIQEGVIKTSKLADVSTDSTFANASNTVLPSQLAAKTYIDSREFTSYYNYLRRTTNQGLSNSYSKVSMETKVVGGTSYLVNGEWNCPAAGNYFISWMANIHANAYGNAYGKLKIAGSDACFAFSDGSSSNGQDVVIGCSIYKSGLVKDQRVVCYVKGSDNRGGTCYDFHLYCTKASG